MIKPAIPIDEELRLTELKSFAILDTAEEAAFEEIVWLASEIAKTSMAFISLVDSSRQWCKSSLKWSFKELPREVSFCGHVVANKAQLIISNASLDPRFCDNPLVLDSPKIQFFAGFPLQTPSGQVLGALCVADSESRILNDKQLQSLEYLSHQVMREFHQRKLNKEFFQTSQELQKSQLLAQQHLLELEKEARIRALGKLAFGISDEINNSLTIISGKAQMVMRLIQEGLLSADHIEEHIEAVLRACNKIATRTKSFTKFSRDSSSDVFETIKVKNLVEEVHGFFDQKIKKLNVHFEKVGSEDLELECRSGEISQVLINLIENSLEALQNTEKKQLKIFWVRAKNGLELSVQDNGQGLSPEIRAAGGRGLSLSRKICESHQGQIKLDRRADVTLFTICLPMHQKLKSPTKPLFKANAG